jgi:TfoX/Sxy family transcriptional regulator of competence genes
MAYDEHLAERISRSLKNKHISFEEKKMFGGVAFMVKDKMCVGIIKESLMTRIDPALYEASLKKKGCHEMDFAHRPMRGFVVIDPEGIDSDKNLDYWISLALDYNKIVKTAKKKSTTKKK